MAVRYRPRRLAVRGVSAHVRTRLSLRRPTPRCTGRPAVRWRPRDRYTLGRRVRASEGSRQSVLLNILALVAPEFVREVESALASRGRGDLVSQLASATIARCSHDDVVDAGYIHLVRESPSQHFAKLATSVAETLAFMDAGFNVDVDHDGHIFGIEILNRSDVFTRLRAGGAL